MKALTRVRRACFIAAALLVATAAVAPVVAKAAPADPDADRPIAWNGTAEAAAIHFTTDRKEGLLPLKDVFFANFPDAESDWTPATNNARASTYYPGPAGVDPVGTICADVMGEIFAPDRVPIPPSPTFDFLCRPSPKFPLVAQADNVNPDARTDGSQVIGSGAPLTLVTTSAIAHADRTSVSSDGVIGSVNIIGTPATAPAALAFRRQAAGILGGPTAAAGVTAQDSDNSTLHIDTVVAHTKQSWDTDGALLTKATTTLKGISLAGGAIHIDTMSSDSTARNDGRGISTHGEHITLAGVTVAGQPAAIDQTGVHVGGSSSSVKPLTDALNAALNSQGVQITLANTSGSVGGDGYKTVQSGAEGLIFTVTRHLAIPNAEDDYFATITLGHTATEADADSDRGSQPPAEDSSIGGVTPPESSPATPGSETPGSFEPGTPGTPGTPASFSSTPRKPATRVKGARTGLGQLEAELAGFTIAHRFELVYLAFAFAFVGVCLSSRLLVPRPRRIS